MKSAAIRGDPSQRVQAVVRLTNRLVNPPTVLLRFIRLARESSRLLKNKNEVTRQGARFSKSAAYT
jgi:hypothetical protein